MTTLTAKKKTKKKYFKSIKCSSVFIFIFKCIPNNSHSFAMVCNYNVIMKLKQIVNIVMNEKNVVWSDGDLIKKKKLYLSGFF